MMTMAERKARRCKNRAAVRASSKTFRDAFDASNTKIRLGYRCNGKQSLDFKTQSKGLRAFSLDMALFIVTRTPCLDNLSFFDSFARSEGVKQLLSNLPVACLSRLRRLAINRSFSDSMLSPLAHCSSLAELRLNLYQRTTLTALPLGCVEQPHCPSTLGTSWVQRT